MANMGVIPPRPGYLEEMRRLCDEHGALLIVDETVTGFRLHPGGCQALYGVTGDLATFGKALGAGLPLAAITGRAERHGRPRRRPRAALRHPERAQPRPLGHGREP